MRIASIGLMLLATTVAQGAGKPIPQDKAKMERQTRERLEWNRKTLRLAYDKVGKKDPRWDGHAIAALDLAAKMFAHIAEPLDVKESEVHDHAKKAIDAGCKDPMILYLLARTSDASTLQAAEEHERRMQAGADALLASKYSPYRKATALIKLAGLKAWKREVTPEKRREAERELDAAIDLLPESMTSDPRGYHWEGPWDANINVAIETHRRLSGNSKAAFDRVDAKLAKIKGIEALRLAVKGRFEIQWGWEARGSAVASKVTEEQFRTFATRLNAARADLEKAWKLNPDQPSVATQMVTVELATGGGDREAMETWFERAMTSDGNDVNACLAKLDWLDPKWHGGDSGDEMVAFGRACLATKNWRSTIPLIVVEAHGRFRSYLPEEERSGYMEIKEVWADVSLACKENLKCYPLNTPERSRYAILCMMSQHFKDAQVEFERLGDRLTTWRGYPRNYLTRIKEMRDANVEILEKNARAGVVIEKPEAGKAPK